MTTQQQQQGSVPHFAFYGEYHGHPIAHLAAIWHALVAPKSTPTEPTTTEPTSPRRRVVWLAGDSSLDNKHWLPGSVAPAVNGYEAVLDPPRMREDVAYHLNRLLAAAAADAVAINAAVEESTIAVRTPPTVLGSTASAFSAVFASAFSSAPSTPSHSTAANEFAGAAVDGEGGRDFLLPHDVFLRDHLGSNDVVVVSVGGNDIALRPSASTIMNMLLLQTLNSTAAIDAAGAAAAAGGGGGGGDDDAAVAAAAASCYGLSHFVRMFKEDIESYVGRLVSKAKPRRVVVCCIYYPDEHPAGRSWADPALSALGYNSNPAKLQATIRTIHRLAISRIRIPGVEVVPFAMYGVMDGKTTADYVARVEPSSAGGAKLAAALLDTVLRP